MGNVWKCKTCGKINQAYVGTCGCGGLKEDGILINEENLVNDSESEKKRKWQCPDCLKINELGICTCGHVKTNTDKFIDEKPDLEQNTNAEIKKNIVIAIIIACISVVIFFTIRSITTMDGTYYPIGDNTVCLVLKNKQYEYYDYNLSDKPLYKGSYKKKSTTVVLEGMGEFKFGRDKKGKYIRIWFIDFYRERL